MHLSGLMINGMAQILNRIETVPVRVESLTSAPKTKSLSGIILGDKGGTHTAGKIQTFITLS
jgi:hypothetical protein